MKSITPIDPAIQEYAKKVGVQIGQLLAELLAEGMSITHSVPSISVINPPLIPLLNPIVTISNGDFYPI